MLLCDQALDERDVLRLTSTGMLDQTVVPRTMEVARCVLSSKWTIGASEKANADCVTAGCIANGVKRLMHIPHEMHKKLERLFPIPTSRRESLFKQRDPVDHAVLVVRGRSLVLIGREKTIAAFQKGVTAFRYIDEMPVVRVITLRSDLVRPASD